MRGRGAARAKWRRAGTVLLCLLHRWTVLLHRLLPHDGRHTGWGAGTCDADVTSSSSPAIKQHTQPQRVQALSKSSRVPAHAPHSSCAHQ